MCRPCLPSAKLNTIKYYNDNDHRPHIIFGRTEMECVRWCVRICVGRNQSCAVHAYRWIYLHNRIQISPFHGLVIYLIIFGYYENTFRSNLFRVSCCSVLCPRALLPIHAPLRPLSPKCQFDIFIYYHQIEIKLTPNAKLEPINYTRKYHR